MKKQHLFTLIIICFFLLTCKKYEDGPLFSFHSVKNRIMGEWEIKELLADNTIDSTNSNFNKMFIGIDDVKRNIIRFIYNDSDVLIGLWSIENKKSEINFNFTNHENLYLVNPIASYTQSSWTIKRLTRKECWLECEYKNHNYSLKLSNVNHKK